MTTQRQSTTLDLQFGVTLMSIEDLSKKVEHLLERKLTGEECKFLALASGLLESNRKPLWKAKAGAA
jgi:hypothetical protein